MSQRVQLALTVAAVAVAAAGAVVGITLGTRDHPPKLHPQPGKPPVPAKLPGAEFPTLPSIRMAWDSLEREQQAFVEGLTPGDLARVIEYKNTDGKPFRLTLWPLLQHVPNHATHHRSEIATMITMLSGSPPDTGINTYLLQQTGQ